MSKKIVAIGGGHNGRIQENGTRAPYETGPMDKEIIRLTNKDKPNFLFLANSQLDPVAELGYFKTMKHVYEDMYGCVCQNIKRLDLVNNFNKAEELVSWADIIYEGGGNTLDMIKLWKETGFDKVLKEAWEQGKVMCGVSAGANCWFKECSSDSLQIKYGKDQPLIGMECLGFIDGFYVPHCDEPGRYESVKELLKTRNNVGLLVSNCAALEIIDDEYRVITSDSSTYGFKAYVLKTYWQDEKYIEETIEISKKFKKISHLLTKHR